MKLVEWDAQLQQIEVRMCNSLKPPSFVNSKVSMFANCITAWNAYSRQEFRCIVFYGYVRGKVETL